MKIRVSKGGFQFTDWKIAQNKSRICAIYQPLSYEPPFDTLNL